VAVFGKEGYFREGGPASRGAALLRGGGSPWSREVSFVGGLFLCYLINGEKKRMQAGIPKAQGYETPPGVRLFGKKTYCKWEGFLRLQTVTGELNCRIGSGGAVHGVPRKKKKV